MKFGFVSVLFLSAAGVTSAWSPSTSSSSRRGFMEQVASTSAVVVGSSLASVGQPLPANAVSGLKKVNAKLSGFGLAPYDSVPDGFSVLAEIYGKGKNRFPLLVTFAHPLSWVVTLPSNNVNGEDGTIQAGEYNKGDTATFYVYSEAGHVNNIASQPKELFEKALIKSISQKGDNIYQNFKVTKLVPAKIGNQEYMVADFKYTLLTGAGFEVDRKGIASITSEGPAVQVLWTATVDARYKKIEGQLRDIVASFRCYADGLNLSEELYVDTSVNLV
jgi:hypothetical protein